VCENLPTRPISLWDSEYGCASFINQTSDIPADKLMRLRPNRVIYDAPPPYSGKVVPVLYGAKFKLNDSTTWWTPDETIDVTTQKWNDCLSVCGAIFISSNLKLMG